jgi:branched-chain amino acid transport system ATP-binding protein
MLELERVGVNLAGISVLNDIDLRVPAGCIIGLLGPNGAGKTTLLRTIVGLVRPRAGTIRFCGTDIGATPSYARARLGIGYMPEDRRLVPTLTAEENILSPAWAMRFADAATRLEQIYDVIPELRELRRSPASSLSGGQQKLVALARAMLSGRRLLLLDEPTEGVAPVLADRLVEIIRDMSASDVAIVVAESNESVVAQLFDQEFILERGSLGLPETGSYPLAAPT